MLRCVLLRAVSCAHGAVRVSAHSVCSHKPPVQNQEQQQQQRSCYSTTFTNPHHSPNPGQSKQQDEEKQQFGDYSSDFFSRTTFRKSSPEQQELKYQEDGSTGEQKIRKFRSKTGRRNTPYWYFLQCKKLIKEDKLAEALALFEGDMLKGERLTPEEFNYTVLIGGCGRVGYVKKAFQLYNNMKKRGLDPSDATYTGLFNACAQSPWKQSGLEQALKLRQELRQKNIPLSTITHHALLKTMALCGDLKACFQVLRDMLQSRQAVTSETFQYLLMSCVEDKQQGFRLALQVWHQMLRAGINPDQQNYNILLRAARDCGIGDPALASSLLLQVPEEADPKVSTRRRGKRFRFRETEYSQPLDIDVFEKHLLAVPVDLNTLDMHSDIQSHSKDGTFALSEAETLNRDDSNSLEDGHLKTQISNSTQLMPLSSSFDLVSDPPSTSQSSCLPNLLDPSTCHSNVVTLGTVSTASDRLALMGNQEGFLKQMAKDGLSPNIKTITLLADIVELSSQSVQSLISVAAESRIKLDVAFFNTLIRNAAKSGDLNGAKAVKALMLNRKMHANAQTFCCIALACNKQKDGLQLLSDMQASGIEPNAHVFSALIRQASKRLDYAYLHELLRQMHQLQVPPNEVIIRQLEYAAQYPPSFDKLKSKNPYLEKIDGFRGFYKEWLNFMPGQETPHPWDKYRLPKFEAEEPGLTSENEPSETSQNTSLTSH
ncbi:pentatricopeptide repeat-containing protein 1, mitochondrial [Astyanax mexicanus]|uniref:pentatricopeptide repeat-containing protein 1, mitochondrial n=1 Tax=Astyanax mexicanus TaxID=7994 RepID=UPI0020CAB43C|nr:pentatricopeptide repeat-containing protein 1, mitochondrial [Astyanax mexicanus]